MTGSSNSVLGSRNILCAFRDGDGEWHEQCIFVEFSLPISRPIGRGEEALKALKRKNAKKRSWEAREGRKTRQVNS